MSDWVDSADNSKRSHDVAIEAMRERLEQFRCERIGPHTLYQGDMREIVPLIGQVHSCVTDPPYEIAFMGRKWDGTGISFKPETWRLVYSALLPGAHLASFAGDRTYHKIACAVEDAGFEIRHMCLYLYGTGFPKSRDPWRLEMQEKVEAELRTQGVDGEIEWK